MSNLGLILDLTVTAGLSLLFGRGRRPGAGGGGGLGGGGGGGMFLSYATVFFGNRGLGIAITPTNNCSDCLGTAAKSSGNSAKRL